jgi:hypothetical protein
MVTEDYDPRTSGDISSNWSSFQWPNDNQWHCYEFRVKMNSAPGVADGEWEVWVDGASTPDKHAVKKNVPWVNSGKTTTQGWNWLMILDNVTNASAPLSSRKEMSIYLDDVVVSTNYSGPPPKPVSVSVQTVNSTTSRISWAAGSNGATYLLDGYRIYYGTSSTSLTSSVVAGKVTSFDVTGLQPDQTYYFAITAFNKASYDSIENESNKSNVVYPGSSTSVVPGDLDGDGVVTSDDAQLALDMSVGKVAITAGHIARGDIAPIIIGHSQPDGKIDTNDSIAILAKLAGKISF